MTEMADKDIRADHGKFFYEPLLNQPTVALFINVKRQIFSQSALMCFRGSTWIQ